MQRLGKQDERSGLCDDAQAPGCFMGALRIVTGKWKGDILWHLSRRKHRFGELMRAIPGITQHMLTAQLRDLERHGLVTRTAYAEVPPRVEYELTPAALDLGTVFAAMIDWSVRHQHSLNLTADGAGAEDDGQDDGQAPRRRAG